jgi:general secretion pathway protein H
MTNNRLSAKTNQGFTLIEMMLVIVMIGLMASVVQYNAGGDKQETLLKQTSLRFAGIFDVAAEYSMLNNVELGLFVDKTSYQFLAYDGTRWTDVGDNELLVATPLPDGVEIELELDDLPIEEPLLFDPQQDDDKGLFSDEDSFADEEDEDSDSDGRDPDKKKKKLIPQVYILSGGDLTPFSLTFILSEDLAYSYQSEEQRPKYRVTGIYTTPLTIEGPKLDD